MNIDKDKIIQGDKHEFLKLMYAVNPTRTKKLLSLHGIEVNDELNLRDISETIETSKFKTILRQNKTNTKAFISAFKKGKFKTL